ncbi:hypothetical protein EON80_05845 [bacterium]|nr:MAG: hypothetical protein EON80_05845 [bacterium]
MDFSILFLIIRWLATLACVGFFILIASHNWEQFLIEWRNKKREESRRVESMIMGNGILAAGFLCPLTEHFKLTWLIWGTLFLLDPLNWILIAMPFRAIYSFLGWLTAPVRFLWRQSKFGN